MQVEIKLLTTKIHAITDLDRNISGRSVFEEQFQMVHCSQPQPRRLRVLLDEREYRYSSICRTGTTNNLQKCNMFAPMLLHRALYNVDGVDNVCRQTGPFLKYHAPRFFGHFLPPSHSLLFDPRSHTGLALLL